MLSLLLFRHKLIFTVNKNILDIQIRIGEWVNKMLRVYGRWWLLHQLSRLPQLDWQNSIGDTDTVCLVMGTARTSAQFLFTAYIWRLRLPPQIPIQLMHDGPLPNKICRLAKQLFGNSVQLTDVRSLMPNQEQNAADQHWHQFIKTHRFGRKLLAIFLLSQKHNVIYSDDDTLIFQPPKELVDASEQQVPFLYAPDTSGVQCPMHQAMIDYGRSIGIAPLPDFQAGLLYIRRGILQRATLDKYLSRWTPANDMNFSEQTLLSLVLCEEANVNTLPKSRYINNGAKGRFVWEKDFNYFDGSIVLRHFVGTVRHRYFEAANKLIRSIHIKNQDQCNISTIAAQ